MIIILSDRDGQVLTGPSEAENRVMCASVLKFKSTCHPNDYCKRTYRTIKQCLLDVL